MGKLLIALTITATLLSGCGLFTAHRIDIQQGNAVAAEDVERLAPGMTREQVRYLMGTPATSNLFRTERWDYIYYLHTGSTGATEQRTVTIHFDGDTVSRVERR